MNIIDHKNIKDTHWDKFCEASPEAWLRHLSVGRRFIVALERGREDCSFGVTDEPGNLLAVAPLIAQKIHGSFEREFGRGDLPTLVPALGPGLSRKTHEEVFAVCMNEIDTRAILHNVSRVRMFVDPLTDPVLNSSLNQNPLSAFGYKDESVTTSCLYIRRDEQDLLRDMSDGHRRDIIFASRQGYTIKVFDRENFTEPVGKLFTDLYFAAAEREVGTPLRWEQTFWRVKNGYSLLIFVGWPNEHNRYLSCACVDFYKRRAYYGLSAISPRARGLRGVGHLMQWQFIKELKLRGVEYYELGWQTGGNQKEVGIAAFKRHFGGKPLPLFGGTKFYRH